MQRCIALAQSASGHVAPNPMVGAILLYYNTIIGEGWHKVYGGDHAEVMCINSVKPADKHLISDSTLFVSLEPCVHFGKTPPCTRLIQHYKIPKVVIGCVDPNEKVKGRGISALEEAGVQVSVGIAENECRQLNRIFFTNRNLNRPYIVLKWAESIDGIIGSGNHTRYSISNPITNRWVHKLRSEHAGILIGNNTLLFDQPQLNCRFYPGKSPQRFVLSNHNHIDYISVTGSQIISAAADNKLLDLFNVSSILIEGGSMTLQFFIDNNLWDEAFVIKADKYFEKGVKAPELTHVRRVDKFTLLEDEIHHYVNSDNAFYF